MKDLTGKKFSYLEVVKLSHSKKGAGRYYKCKCDCGAYCVVKGYSLSSGKTISCGHYGREILGKKSFKHGLSNKQVYRTYRNMLQRCYNKKHPSFKNYGGRGISVCGRYKESFVNFFKDLNHPPSPKHSLDRKNSNANYSCGKCRECKEKRWKANIRWATKREQVENTRRNRFITYNGETKTKKQWAIDLNIKQSTLHYRLDNWSEEQALTIPVEGGRSVKNDKSITFNGHRRSLTEWAKILGTTFSGLTYRLNHWTLEDAMTKTPKFLKMRDIVGKRFGRLKAIEYLGKSLYKCICDCGKTKNIKWWFLEKGISNSCGCLIKMTKAQRKEALYGRPIRAKKARP